MLKRLPLELIAPNPEQPRKLFDAKKLEELAQSIQSAGLKQPITVRPAGQGQYEIVMGERRYRAHKLLQDRGLLEGGTILCHVRKMDDEQRDLEAIIENLQRADVTPLEEARAYQRMIEGGMSVEDLAQKIGVAAFRVRERTQLLNLAPVHLKLFESGNLDRQQAFEISRLENEADQTRIVQMIAKGQLTGWKAVRAAVEAIVEGKTQQDIFGDSAPRVSDEEAEALNAMEAKIERMATLAAAGWKDGECVVATKVSPDRALTMADKIKHMRVALARMESQLRAATAEVQVVAA
ncbi:MAG: ParB/RepB/Spo0J family partition protein [Beijerinckiaceae bacterium]